MNGLIADKPLVPTPTLMRLWTLRTCDKTDLPNRTIKTPTSLQSGVFKIMIVKRINDWARSHPSDIAVISDGRALTYAAFARSIQRTRTFFGTKNLPLGK